MSGAVARRREYIQLGRTLVDLELVCRAAGLCLCGAREQERENEGEASA